MAYGGDPANDANDALRLHVFDTSTSTAGEFLSDAEVTYVRGAYTGLNAQVAAAARILEAKFASTALMKQVGDLKIQHNKAEEYRKLAKDYARRAALNVTPFVGGISESGKDAVRDDTDRVPSVFTRNQFTHPDLLPSTST